MNKFPAGRARGVIATVYLYLLAALILLAVIWGIVHEIRSYLSGIESAAYKRGQDEVTVRWQKADLDRNAKEAARQKALQVKVDEETGKRQAAEAKATDYQTKWEREVNEHRRTKQKLGTVNCPAASAGDGGAQPEPDIHLTWLFVHEHDSAWTGVDGQPLFTDISGPPPAAAGPDSSAASPYGLDDLISNHGENARRFSACVRDYGTLINTIDKLQKEWDQRGP